MRAFFSAGNTRNYAFRRQQLQSLHRLIFEHEEEIIRVLAADFGKPTAETYASEIAFLYQEINHTLKHLRNWMRPKKVSTPLVLQPSKSRIYFEPKGVVLVVGPWNYPFQLTLAPVVAAMAAGNCVVIKPSELTPQTSALIKHLINNYFSPEYLVVVEGEGAQIVPELIDKYHFDHIFFTGSTRVGAMIAEQAGRHLISTTLELGGKSPAIVERSATFEVAARRLLWGKFFNSGQTCVAPDYLLLDEEIADSFIEILKNNLLKFYDDPSQASRHLARIVGKERWKTLVGYLEQGKILYGGQYNEERLYIAPTLLQVTDLSQSVMQEEIFGPILPIITYQNCSEALEIIERNPYPLAFYLFTREKKKQNWYLEHVQFGGGAINNAMVHLSNPNLPFGGINQSGHGRYHGYEGFSAFSNHKSVLHSDTWFDPDFKYPPYSKTTLKWFRRLLG
ncbi:aldehyde dehydrogenase family protein [Nitrosococcus watsonii]|nr:aldehyde dehydrogenase family protein [Nitrosococcus watsonii]